MSWVKILRETNLTFISPAVWSTHASLNYSYARWTNMPLALTELFGATSHRQGMDLSNYLQVRIIVNVVLAGAATPALIVAQYSTDLGLNWNYFDSAGANSGPSVDISTTGLKVSSWITMDAVAKADVYIRIAGLNGDGAVDPQFGLIAVQFK